MRRLIAIAMAAFTVVTLTSCAFWPFGPGGYHDDDTSQVRNRLEQIMTAVDEGDAAALKQLFSKTAVAQAPALDDSIDYFLSFFPNGAQEWTLTGIGKTGVNKYGAKTELLKVGIRATVDGAEYWVFFADFTSNDTIDRNNVGLFALGVTPRTGEDDLGPEAQMTEWAEAISWDELGDGGYPGVFVPQPEVPPTEGETLDPADDELVVAPTGVDPVTSRFSVVRSTN